MQNTVVKKHPLNGNHHSKPQGTCIVPSVMGEPKEAAEFSNKNYYSLSAALVGNHHRLSSHQLQDEANENHDGISHRDNRGFIAREGRTNNRVANARL